MLRIRQEELKDKKDIFQVNSAAFSTNGEAELVDKLRDDSKLFISFVAVLNDEIVAHIAYSRVVIDEKFVGLGLAPLAVLPPYQKQKIGTELVMESLRVLKDTGHPWVVVLGHETFYPRFGFIRSDKYAISCEYESAPEQFMILELQPESLVGVSGVTRYHPAFRSL